jgi:Spy/CpxP family protein refolding chaperone
MKKGVIVILAIMTIGFAGYRLADARSFGGGGMMGHGGGYGNCDNCWGGSQQGQLDDETIKAREKFFSETEALRKNMAVKQAEMAALMNRENPDEKKAAKLAGEIFELRSELHKKAAENGLNSGYGGCRGGGPGQGPGMKGPGMGGRGPGAAN